MTRTLPPMETAARLDRLRACLPGAGCDALLVTSLTNIRYLTGFTGSAALLLVQVDDALFVSDGRYRDQAADQIAAARVQTRIEIAGTEQKDILSAAGAGIARLGLEAEYVTWAQQRTYDSEWFLSAEVIPTEGLVDGLRLVKDEGEVARIEAACAIADQALGNVRGRLFEGVTEAELALELDTEMRRLGADGSSFETIVASGPNGAKPHARPSPRRIEDGDLVVIDFGALVDGYHSDMTRTIAVGELSDTQRRMVEVVRTSQAAGVAAVRAGATGKAVDDVCRTVIANAGWGDAFLHGTGHGVGLDIHEAPRVSAVSTATLAAGHVVTVEPGVYLPEHGGVRIEDTVVVTEDGCRILTRAPKD